MADDVDYLVMGRADDGILRVADVLRAPDMDVETAAREFERLEMTPLMTVCDIRKSRMGAIRYHPRIGRRLIASYSLIRQDLHGPLNVWDEKGVPTHPCDGAALADSMNLMADLTRILTDVFANISPEGENLRAYGHSMGNGLLLACIGFENECRGVLRANGYPMMDRLNTRDYFKVKDPLRLAEYAVTLPSYPKLGERVPFSSWRAEGGTTETLPWYHAYNSYKHDRYVNAANATLENLVDAVSAIAIMLAAQYRAIASWRQRIGDFFAFVRVPSWEVEDSYVVPFVQEQWRAVNFPFEITPRRPRRQRPA